MYQNRGAFAYAGFFRTDFAGFFRTDHDPPGELNTLY